MHDFELCNLSLADAETAAAKAQQNGISVLIGALVHRPDGSLFAQRRSPNRKFGAGLWDNVGGHIEGDETLHQALTREVIEETGWTLNKIHRIIATRTWQTDKQKNLEFIALCTVNGDLNRPTLETGKIDATLWVNAENIATLNENRGADTSQATIYAHARNVAQEITELNVDPQPH